jgi:hypothetical protein
MPKAPSGAKPVRLPYFLLAVVTATVLAVVASWLLASGLVMHGGGKASLPAGPGPISVSEAQLKKLASETDHHVYWAGPKSGTYELTRTTDGRIYVRYLPSGAKVGDPAARYLTIGTYAGKNAFRSIQRAAHRPGAVSVKLGNGGLLVFNTSAPKSVYFGYPGANYQVEVYDPSPDQARALVLGGTVKPIG